MGFESEYDFNLYGRKYHLQFKDGHLQSGRRPDGTRFDVFYMPDDAPRELLANDRFRRFLGWVRQNDRFYDPTGEEVPGSEDWPEPIDPVSMHQFFGGGRRR